MSIDEIAAQCSALKASHIVLTGGEPMIFNALPLLCESLRKAGYHLTIETAGTIYQPAVCDLISISPKLSSSAPRESSGSWQRQHQLRRERLDVVLQLMREHGYQLKFVVDCESDALEVLDYLDRLGDFDGERVLLMPQGTDQLLLERQAEWLLPWCQRYGLRFCPRAHIGWFGNRRAT